MNSSHLLTMFFVGLLAVSVLLEGGLVLRQLRHLRAHRSAVPERFAAVVSLEQHQKAVDYASAKLKLALFSVGMSAVWFMALTWGGGLAWGWAQANASVAAGVLPPWGAALALIMGVLALGIIIEMPVAAWSQFSLEARFGFNRSTWGLFVLDQLKGLLLLAVLGIPLLLGVLWLMGQRAALGPWWWVVLWAKYVLVSLGLAVLFPTVIAPVFNRFTPLPEGTLKTRLEALLVRCRFAARGLFVMDGSRRSSHGNAFFAGIGRTRRIVLFDTLLETLSESELEAVLAHEIGHYRCGHIPRQLVFGFLLAFVAIAAFGLWMDHPALLTALGVPAALADGAPALQDALGLYLFALVLPMGLLPLRPLASLLSRRYEYEADAFAAQETNAPALIHALVALHRDNAAPLTTDAWYSNFHDSHPPAPLRIAALENWVPKGSV